MTPTKIIQYDFDTDIVARVRKCYQNDSWHGPLELLEHWAVIGASMAASIWMWDYAPVPVAIIGYIAAVWFIGGRQRALADILHQAAHRTLMKNTRIGRALGTYLSGYLILQSYSGYVASHVRDHHGHLGDPELDPDYRQYRQNGLCGADMSPRAIKTYLIKLASPRVMLGYVQYLLRDRILPREERKRERVTRLVFLTAVVAVIVTQGDLLYLLMYWVVPLLTTQVWIGSLIELVEHYPLIETAPRLDIYVSRNRHCSRLSNFLLGITPHEGYHLIHHKFAAVPPWRHRQVHEILLEDPVYAALNATRGWRAILREVVTLHSDAVERAAAVSKG